MYRPDQIFLATDYHKIKLPSIKYSVEIEILIFFWYKTTYKTSTI